MRNYLIGFTTSDGHRYQLQFGATNPIDARTLVEQQYGKVTIWKLSEQREPGALSTPASPRSQRQAPTIPRYQPTSPRDDDSGGGLFGLIILAAYVPILGIVGLPALFVFRELSTRNTHGALLLVAVLLSLAAMVALLIAIFAYVPQTVLAIVGFALYAAIGYAFGKDQIWGLVIGASTGLVGAFMLYQLGNRAKGY